ncbi:calcium-binding protein [Sulfitobacter sp. F26169L]|uniref:calcium-binding protein n=1 Tax=Sulfitobacter sp. F26169L TaxID=2996015 RepID=UPI0022609446|nr:calcium-binding protein [Sulfitobacter sp. F26169L]MCX7566936.1 calcium-binding protein [Sulfitobacter sp. F26169L]
MAVAHLIEDLEVAEGHEGALYLRVEEIREISFQYQYEAVTEMGTASAEDYSVTAGHGSVSVSTTGTTGRTISMPFATFADNLAEEDETFFVSVQLSGVSFRNGSNSKLVEVTIKNNDRPTGEVSYIGDAVPGREISVDVSDIQDLDGLGPFRYQWLINGGPAPVGTFLNGGQSYIPDRAYGEPQELSLQITYTDQEGMAELIEMPPITVLNTYFNGTDENDLLTGTAEADLIFGRLGSDTIQAGDGDDRIIGGGDDWEINDLRDVVYGESGNDSIDGGYGNDDLNGGGGNDTIIGGFGGDTVVGNSGDDHLSGGALGDVIFGNAGDDFINGGFGYDRLNGGTGADTFFHIGIYDHGSDWIQDFSADDILKFGGDATLAQFQVNTTNTAGAGDDATDEAFVIYKPTGQIIWALVDGAAHDSITLGIGSDTFELML